METLSKQDKLDEMAILRLELMDELISCKKDMENYLREGFFLLGKARYILGANSVSILQTPSTDCDIFSLYNCSVSKEPLEDFPSITINKYEVFSTQDSVAKVENKDWEVRQRGKSEKINEDTQVTEEKIEKKTSDPLNWFSALPPSSLRMAQRNFKMAITKSAECATIQSKLQSLDISNHSNE